MNRQIFRVSGVLALSTILVASALPAAARGAAGTRPHSQGSSSSGSSHSSGRGGGHSSGGTATHAQGHATYGHGHGGHWHHPYSWDWYYGPWWGLGAWWGWPGYWADAWWYGWPTWNWGPYPGAYPGHEGERVDLGPAIVETSIRPRKALVVVDGEPVGKARDFNGTWDSLELDPGRHLVVFEARGYETLEVGIDARPGRRYRISYELREGEGKDARSTPLPPPAPEERGAPSMPPTAPPPSGETGRDDARRGLARGFVRIAVTPPDAAVYLDGEFLGRGDELQRLHGAIPVATGEHRIEVVRPGYRSRAEQVTVNEGEPAAVIRVDLDREGGSSL
jgi:hypothetical protein